MNLKTYQRKWRINRPKIVRFVRKSWSEILSIRRWPATCVAAPPRLSRHPVEISVIFLNDRQIQYYNKQYRKKDYPTDVLSFRVNEVLDHHHYLGDLLISPERAAKQARMKAHSFDRELRILLLHGLLHLTGLDHETDSGEMDRMEQRLRKILIEPQEMKSSKKRQET